MMVSDSMFSLGLVFLEKLSWSDASLNKKLSVENTNDLMGLVITGPVGPVAPLCHVSELIP